ncbi:MAG: DUF368 domain-containing protein [Burkholderiaceae bacterium]
MLRLFLTGLAIGAANVIPGVSGGTIALLTGVYERLLGAIGRIGREPLRLLRAGHLERAWRTLDGPFLFAIGAGVAVGIVTLAKLLERLLKTHEIETMAFFFGLILVSIYYVGRRVGRWGPGTTIMLVLGAAIAAGIALLAPASEDASAWYVFLCGVVAICSMILPGLSGSFVLIMMGNYSLVLGAVSRLEFAILLPMVLGCAIGLLVFAKLLNWVFARWHDLTIALMTGFVLGSLAVIWPWKHKHTLEIARSDGSVKTVTTGYDWFGPPWGSTTLVAVGLMITGGLVIWAMERFAGRDEPADATGEPTRS